jgi:hypothetical protein
MDRGNRGAALVAPLVAVVVILLNPHILRSMTRFMGFIIGVDDSAPAHPKDGHHKTGIHIHISPENWMYIGLTLAACVALTLLFFAVNKTMTWHNSPAKVEARAVRESDALRRIQQGLADNNDYQQLLAWKKELAKRQTPEAIELRTAVDE